MIELRQLSKTIDGNQVLKDVSLTIEKEKSSDCSAAMDQAKRRCSA